MLRQPRTGVTFFTTAMSKSERIAAFVGSLDIRKPLHDVRYAAYFACFARGDYYEAHDVLEDLWLAETGRDRDFYKGLIQLAGAFVHMKKQRERPDHPKDGRRLRPAVRLLALSRGNLAPYAPTHLGLRVGEVCESCIEIEAVIVSGEFSMNPLSDNNLASFDLSYFIR
jgi:hypothetical protein